jgi:hypothetical protein
MAAVLVPVLAAIPTLPAAMRARERQDKPQIDVELFERVAPPLGQRDQAQVQPEQRNRCQRPG